MLKILAHQKVTIYNEISFFLKNEKVCTNNSSLISKFSSKHIDKDGCGSKS